MIYRTEAFFGSARVTICAFIVGVLFAVMQFPAFAAGGVTLTWQVSTDTNVVGYNVYFGGVSETYTNKISAGDATSAIISNLVPGATYYFAATAYDSTGLESPFSNEASYVVPQNVGDSPGTTNNLPTLNGIPNLSINKNAGVQTMNLSGISPGTISGKPKLKITATTSNSNLIPKPKISYSSANPTGKFTFKPKKNATGTATITVIVNNGEKTNNLVTQTFTVTVIDLNQPPTLNPISSLFLTENAGEQTVGLSGISSGIVTKQKIKITAASSDQALIPAPKAKYTSANLTGTLTFTPKKDATGTATITVTVNNGEKSENLVSQTFTVTILAPSSTTPLATIKTGVQNQDLTPLITPASPITIALTPAAHADGQFALSVSSSSDQECIIQASTNLVDWIPVWTNTPPFTYTDINAGQFSQRFYRPVPAP